MKRVVCALLFIFSISAYGQIKFENGYIITNDDQRVNCLIRNLDWKNNPSEIKYKITENSDILTATIDLIKEFQVDGYPRYRRFEVEIDRSPNEFNQLGWNRNPEFKNDTLFLKLLVDGEAALYYYESATIRRYFYQTENSTVRQLVYKQYLVDQLQVGVNESFKQQLLSDLKCNDKLAAYINRSDYIARDLIKIFVRHNQCAGGEIKNYSAKKSRLLLNVTLRPGLTFASLQLKNAGSSTSDTKFETKPSFQPRAELELIFPFRKNKWSIFFEPSYQTYKSSTSKNAANVSVNYSSFEIPTGLRHYFFLTDKSKVFLNAMYIFDFPTSKSRIDFSNSPDLDIESNGNLAVGAGVNVLGKYSAEIRYGTRREITNMYLYWRSNYQTLSVIFGYTIF